LGARVPVIPASRGDNTLARLGSCALALLLIRHKQSERTGPAIADEAVFYPAAS
jgi:hypothetical protein